MAENNQENLADPHAIVAGSSYDIDPNPDRCNVHSNEMSANGASPAAAVTDAGYPGADLLWDLSGTGNSWDQPGASRLPYTLPASSWSELRRRANLRLWRLLMAVSG